MEGGGAAALYTAGCPRAAEQHVTPTGSLDGVELRGIAGEILSDWLEAAWNRIISFSKVRVEGCVN
jgi:hypothetical protein